MAAEVGAVVRPVQQPLVTPTSQIGQPLGVSPAVLLIDPAHKQQATAQVLGASRPQEDPDAGPSSWLQPASPSSGWDGRAVKQWVEAPWLLLALSLFHINDCYKMETKDSCVPAWGVACVL